MTRAAHSKSRSVDAHRSGGPIYGNDDSGLFEYSGIPADQDDAQAVLQPAMSAAAIHLTSCHTSAVEKAAALDRPKGVAPLDDPRGFADADEDGEDGDTTPEQVASPKISSWRKKRHSIQGDGDDGNGHPPASPGHLPSPWRSRPRQMQTTAGESHTTESRGILGAAFGHARKRSSSPGQDALKRLQKAFPSLASPGNLLPSFPTSLLSNFSDCKQNGRTPARASTSQAASQQSGIESLNRARARTLPRRMEPQDQTPVSPPSALRKVASDDSLLYSTVSRVSSLGDDERFVDVRGMVNTRLLAIKDSLPDVPNFKMPSLARLQAASKRSTLSLNGLFSNEPPVAPPSNSVERESDSIAKDDSTTLDSVLEELTGDLVIMGGYRGSILRSAEPPHHQLWAPVKIGLNMRKANLEVGLNDEDEENAEETIIADGMLQNIGPIDISRKFFKKLRSCENARSGKLRVWDYGYDWRLSPSRLSKRLLDFLQALPSNQPGVPAEQRGAIVIAHSLGGLITRHAVNQQPALFAGVLYAGTPQRCVNILGPLRHGDAVLFNDKLLTAQVNFSIRTSFALLPDDGFCFIDKTTGEEYPVDFFDPMSWVKWHLSPCLAPPLPPFNRQQQYSSLSSLFPNSLLRPRGDSKSEKRSSFSMGTDTAAHSIESAITNFQNRTSVMPHLHGGSNIQAAPPAANGAPSTSSFVMDPETFGRNLEYLERTLASIRRFRSETAHDPSLEYSNVYPPFAVMYGKSIPTVYAARVNGRESIPCSDAYDDLVFRPGDGVVLAKESMLPDGYSVVRGGRVRTERGHITMLGDMPALGRALKALLRGRRKGIGLGERRRELGDLPTGADLKYRYY